MEGISRIERSVAATAARARRLPPASSNAPEAAETSSRQLATVAPVELEARPFQVAGRPLATFVAHLIATDRQLPQTRVHRRVDPGEAIGAYAATTARISAGQSRGFATIAVQ